MAITLTSNVSAETTSPAFKGKWPKVSGKTSIDPKNPLKPPTKKRPPKELSTPARCNRKAPLEHRKARHSIAVAAAAMSKAELESPGLEISEVPGSATSQEQAKPKDVGKENSTAASASNSARGLRQRHATSVHRGIFVRKAFPK